MFPCVSPTLTSWLSVLTHSPLLPPSDARGIAASRARLASRPACRNGVPPHGLRPPVGCRHQGQDAQGWLRYEPAMERESTMVGGEYCHGRAVSFVQVSLTYLRCCEGMDATERTRRYSSRCSRQPWRVCRRVRLAPESMKAQCFELEWMLWIQLYYRSHTLSSICLL